MTVIVHISDLHFGRTDAEPTAALPAHIAADKPDFTVISGDLTQNARHREFAAAQAFINGLSGRTVVVPGNHDITPYNLIERFYDPFGRFRRYFGETLNPVTKAGTVGIVGLNSARSAALHWNWSHGRISPSQIRHAERNLAGCALKIVITHHPFLPPQDVPKQKLIGRSRRAMRAFSAAGVDVLLCGHVHNALSSATEQRRYRTAARPLLVVQAGTATSSRLRGEANGYNVLLFREPDLTVIHKSWTGTGFAPTAEARFRRSANGWRRLDAHPTMDQFMVAG